VWLTPQLATLAACSRWRRSPRPAVIVLLALTAAQVIFGELVPKSLALQYPTPSALYTLPPMVASLWIYRPFIRWLNGSGLLLLRLLGAPQAGAPPHPLARRDRAAHRREPRGRPARARRAPAAAARAAAHIRPAKQLMVPRTRMAALDVETPMTR
jgi:CBS domain containing-hemolysin-like protein